MPEFYQYLRGLTDQIPAGYSQNGMQLYRHLVYLGVHQLLAEHFPQVRAELGEANWKILLETFIRQSQWDSHYYGDLTDEFVQFLARESA